MNVGCRSVAQAILAAWTFAGVEVQSDGTQLGERRGRDYLGLADRLPLVEHIGDIQSWVAPRIPSTQSH